MADADPIIRRVQEKMERMRDLNERLRDPATTQAEKEQITQELLTLISQQAPVRDNLEPI
jgi:hypothetical protein